MSIEAMKMALEALETVTKEMLALRDKLAEHGGRPQANEIHQRLWDSSYKVYVDTAIPTAEALRQAIKQAQKQEPVAGVSDYECRRLLYGFMLDCNLFGFFEASENLHKGMKQAAHGIKGEE